MENSTDYFFECCKGINSKLAYYFELKNKNDASLKKEMDNTLGHVHLFASEMSDTCRNLTFDDEKTQELYNRIL